MSAQEKLADSALPDVKRCTRCGDAKPLDAFLPKPNGTRTAECRECKRARSQAYIASGKEAARLRAKRQDPEWLARNRASKEKYNRTERGREVNRALAKAAKERYPEKNAARSLLSSAVRCGRIARQPCEVCGSTTRIHGHHDDYSKPLEVRWLCPTHHRAVHAALRKQET